MRARLGAKGELVKVLPRSTPAAPTGISFGLLLVTTKSDAELQNAIGGTASEILDVAATEVEATPVPVPAESPAFFEQEENQDWSPGEQSSIRVDVRRLDEALEQLSGLFVTRFKLERVAADLGEQGTDIRDLKAVIAETSRQLRRLRTAISEARMVPLSDLLQRLPLVVRGITNGTDKAVNVTIHAGSAEVDKAVADKIFPALIHIVRNAVDHALESKSERLRAGKSEVGELTVLCDDSSGTNLILTITDDGRGIDREAVAAKSGRPLARTDEELLQQICMAGLSTSRSVTHTSGRGMGMDIVKRTVEVLGGAISLKTVHGKGTSISVRVPVTVTIVDVLSFVCGGQTFVAPVAIVDEIVEVDPKLSVLLPVTAALGPQPRLIQHRGKAIPLFTLDSLLQPGTESRIPLKAMIVNQLRGPIAFGVDRMIGKQEAVVRPLDDSLVRVVGLSGATDLGDGRPTLVLDLASLGDSVMSRQEVNT